MMFALLKKMKRKLIVVLVFVLFVPTAFAHNGRSHRWELPVLRYHRFRVNFPYPFWGVIYGDLHDFIIRITIKIVQSLPFSPLRGTLPYFTFKLPYFTFQIFVQNYLFPITLPKQITKNGQHSPIFGIEVLIEMIVSDFRNVYITLTAPAVIFSVWPVFSYVLFRKV